MARQTYGYLPKQGALLLPFRLYPFRIPLREEAELP